MTDHQPQWGCPYCTLSFPSKGDLKKHLEPDEQFISHLFRQLQQALRPNCRQTRKVDNGSITSNGGDDVGVSSTNQSDAKQLTCPIVGCRQAMYKYSKKTHLLRHFKEHVVCDDTCECNKTFNRISEFEKHLTNNQCSVMQDILREDPGLEQSHEKIRMLKATLNSRAKKSLDQELKRSQKHDLSDDAMESSSSYKAISTKLPASKRKRTTAKVRLSMVEDAISSNTPSNSDVQRGPLKNVGTISSYTSAIAGVQTDRHMAVNNLGATQAFENPISLSPLNPNESSKASIENSHSVNPGSDIIGTVDTGLDWSVFNACGPDPWDSLTSVRNLEQYHSDRANIHGDTENWRYSSNDWSSFHSPFDVNNALCEAPCVKKLDAFDGVHEVC